ALLAALAAEHRRPLERLAPDLEVEDHALDHVPLVLALHPLPSEGGCGVVELVKHLCLVSLLVGHAAFAAWRTASRPGPRTVSESTVQRPSARLEARTAIAAAGALVSRAHAAPRGTDDWISSSMTTPSAERIQSRFVVCSSAAAMATTIRRLRASPAAVMGWPATAASPLHDVAMSNASVDSACT